ncbi:putative alcohol dehydrogenase [Helianthus annuus]|nr:putative alcohol dehydrogenase [Helianthus annuus]KAJ0583983.1 putative alcohol dehydrogenase [Helianthus annuus]
MGSRKAAGDRRSGSGATTAKWKSELRSSSLPFATLMFTSGKPKGKILPRILGHEARGVVESVGEGVNDLQPGDHVLPVFTGEFKECAHCKSERSNMCVCACACV